VTCAIPLAKLTSAWTPGCLASVRRTRTAQEPQVKPCTEKSSAARSGPDRSAAGVHLHHRRPGRIAWAWFGATSYSQLDLAVTLAASS